SRVGPAVSFPAPAPWFLAPRPVAFTGLGLAAINKAADPNEQGRAPDAVRLLERVRFEGPPRPERPEGDKTPLFPLTATGRVVDPGMNPAVDVGVYRPVAF